MSDLRSMRDDSVITYFSHLIHRSADHRHVTAEEYVIADPYAAGLWLHHSFLTFIVPRPSHASGSNCAMWLNHDALAQNGTSFDHNM
jgi:hypothetical protein